MGEIVNNLPSLVQLFLTNTVIIAAIMGIGLNLLINVLFKGEEEDEEIVS